MKLDHVEIKNFRSIKEINLNFNLSCRVLVGINESGKSNILNALSLLSNDYSPEKQRDQREALPDEDTVKEAFVKFIFKFEEKELDKIFETLLSNILSNVKNPDIVSSNENNKSVKDFCTTQNKVLYHIDILEQKKSPKYFMLSEDDFTLLDGWKKPTNDCPPDFQVELKKDQKYILKDYKLIQLSDASTIPEHYLENATLKDLEELVGSIIEGITIENLPKVIFWEYKEENLLPNTINIEDFISNPNSCVPLKNMFTLSGIESISEGIQDKRKGTINQFQNYLNGIAEKTTKHFKKVWKEYKSIEFSLRKEHNMIIPGVKEKNTYDFDKRSDGFKRFVTFLLMISARVTTNLLENTLLLVDEAEVSLHPSGVRYLRDELIKIANTNYVVYSTHSIFMIDSGNNKRHYIVKKENEITTISEAEESNIKDEEVLYNALGFSIFEVLEEKNIIFEGWRDKCLFETYIKNLPKIKLEENHKDIGLCHANGVSTIKTITSMIELAKRTCLILSDSDREAKQSQKLYQKEKNFGDWKTYQDIDPTIKAITGEDFIKNGCIVKNVNTVLSNIKKAPTFNESFLKEKVGKLEQIKLWLRENDISEGEQKDIIKKIKDSIFKNLKSENIDTEYKKLFKGISLYF